MFSFSRKKRKGRIDRVVLFVYVKELGFFFLSDAALTHRILQHMADDDSCTIRWKDGIRPSGTQPGWVSVLSCSFIYVLQSTDKPSIMSSDGDAATSSGYLYHCY